MIPVLLIGLLLVARFYEVLIYGIHSKVQPMQPQRRSRRSERTVGSAAVDEIVLTSSPRVQEIG